MPKVFAMFGPVMGLAALLGPIIGGGLVGLDLLGTGWRLVFLVNLPVGLLALGCGLRLLPAGSPDRGLGRDWLGSLMTAVAGAALVYPLMEGRSLGWPAWTFMTIGARRAGLIGFAYEQRRGAARGIRPWAPRACSPTAATATVWPRRCCSSPP